MDENSATLEDIIVEFQNTRDKEILTASREKRNKSHSKVPELKVTLDFSLLARQSRSNAFSFLGEDGFQHRLIWNLEEDSEGI